MEWFKGLTFNEFDNMLAAPIKTLRKAAFKYLHRNYDILVSDDQARASTNYASSQEVRSSITVEEEKSLYSIPARIQNIRDDCLSTADTILTNEEIFMPIFLGKLLY